jgi:hypothetical protein
MKKMRYRGSAWLSGGLLLLGMASCSNDFLKEEDITKLDQTYFDTPEGIRDLSQSLPSGSRIFAELEYSYIATNYGTDEFRLGSDPSNSMWNDYNSGGFQSVVSGGSTNRQNPGVIWDICAISINNCNIVLEKAPKLLTDPAELKQVLAEARFMRGFMYLYMVQQWGGVPIKNKPSVSVEKELPRNTHQETIDFVIADLDEAYKNLTNPGTHSPGRVSKDAAAHFLAKALIYRQSEICAAFNASTKSADLTEALRLCDEVIARHPLANNFADLWDYKTIDGANEFLPEVIFSAQFTANNLGMNGRGNSMHFYYVSIYQQWTGMIRDHAGGREFARLRTTDYAMDIYDRVNDSRFWKSFRTTQAINTLGELTSADAKERFALGQLGVLWIINNPGDDRYMAATATIAQPNVQPARVAAKNPLTGAYEQIKDPVTGNVVPSIIPRYRVISTTPPVLDDKGAITSITWTRDLAQQPTYAYVPDESSPIWPSLSKYIDGLRIGNQDTANGTRDAFVARVAETYLMADEVKLRQGDIPGMFPYIQAVRDRAAYKAGEDRSAYVDGGQGYKPSVSERQSSFYGKNSYYYSNDIAATTAASSLAVTGLSNLPMEDLAVINELGYTTDFDKAMCFLLNERSRELMGEQHRWVDLARTKTLIDRAYAYNAEVDKVGDLAEHHYFRPIPQEYLDLITTEGRPLTPAEKKAMQNPGYL